MKKFLGLFYILFGLSYINAQNMYIPAPIVIDGQNIKPDTLWYGIITLNGQKCIEIVGAQKENIYSGYIYIPDIIDNLPVKSIGKRAFYFCHNITYIRYSNNITTIGDEAFCNCSGITSIELPNNVTTIKEEAFESCKNLKSIKLSNNLKYIGDRAFWFCDKLESISIHNSVTTIGTAAFAYTSLTSIHIPQKVSSIGTNPFENCSKLRSITVDSNNKFYDSRNDCNAIIKTASNTLIAGCMNTIIPNTTTSIGVSSFDGCDSLTYINIPNSVTSIRLHAFFSCENLTSIDMSENLISIGSGAFTHCKKLSSIEFPLSLDSIDDHAFYGCHGIPSIHIPQNVSYIGRNPFVNCIAISNMTVDTNNTYYNSNNDCNAIIETKSNTLISGCMNSVILSTVEIIGDEAFCGCDSLTNIEIPTRVKYIGDMAFERCRSLTSIIIPDSVTYIGRFAFADCYNMSYLKLPHSELVIGNYAFEFCDKLNSFIIPNSVKYIGSDAFYIPYYHYYHYYYRDSTIHIYCTALTPPPSDRVIFYEIDEDDREHAKKYKYQLPILYVPNQVIDTYAKNETWGKKYFDEIKGIVSGKYVVRDSAYYLNWKAITSTEKYNVVILKPETDSIIANMWLDNEYDINSKGLIEAKLKVSIGTNENGEPNQSAIMPTGQKYLLQPDMTYNYIITGVDSENKETLMVKDVFTVKGETYISDTSDINKFNVIRKIIRNGQAVIITVDHEYDFQGRLIK